MWTEQDGTPNSTSRCVDVGGEESEWWLSHLLGSSGKLAVYSSVSQNIFMDQFRCIKDLHSFSSLSLSFSKWSQITSIFTFRKVLIVPRCKQGRYETVLISYFLRYDLCSNFFLYTFVLTLWQKNSYNWIHTYLFVKSFFVGVYSLQ